jgi:hypothetical protein
VLKAAALAHLCGMRHGSVLRTRKVRLEMPVVVVALVLEALGKVVVAR